MAYKKIDKYMRGNKITLEQIEEVVRLYMSKKYSIKEILVQTGVRSEQTIYRILDGRNDIERMRRKSPVKKISITLDEDTNKIIDKTNPKNLSEWVCSCIKKATII